MPAPPAKNDVAGSGSTPSNAQARAGFGALWETLFGTSGLLGSTGASADARDALGVGSTLSNRNLLINANGAINQRSYISGIATSGSNQYTLDRWRVVTSGQSLSFGAATPDRTMTAPAGGVEQVIQASAIAGGVYCLSWIGSATATVNGTAITNGGTTVSLPANTSVTVRFSGGTVLNPQFERGKVPTPFERPDPDLEMVKARRRFQFIKGTGPIATGGWTTSATTAVSLALRFPQMAAPPTIQPNGGVYSCFDGSIQANVTSIATAFVTDEVAGLDISVAGGFTTNRPATLYISTGGLALIAEL